MEVCTPFVWAPYAFLAWISLLLILCYFPVLRLLVGDWYHDADMGHGFFVIPVAALLAWQRRDRLAAVAIRPSLWGIPLLAGGGLQLLVATIGAELFLARSAFVISIAGTVLLLYGWGYLRVLGLPIGLLFLMIPIPAIIYSQITLPLQFVASFTGEHLIRLSRYPVVRAGNLLTINGHSILVAEACSGIRSLLTLAFLSLAFGAFTEKSRTIRGVLFLATVPIALAANAVRVGITGILAGYKPSLAEGFVHEASGWIIFVVSFLLLVGGQSMLRRLIPGAGGSDGAPAAAAIEI